MALKSSIAPMTPPVRNINAGCNRMSAPRTVQTKPSSDNSSDLWAHLPPYSPPQTTLFRRIPNSFIPYAELMRLHKPAGYYAFFFPHLTGTLLAAARGPATPTPRNLVSVIVTHAIANVFLRGSACAYNDALDGPFDRLVERCRHRPVARGAVSPFSAHAFAAAQAIIWIAMVATLPTETVKTAMWLSLTMILYPWCKRFTNYPQVVLGFSLALGQGIGAGTVGWDVLAEKDPWKLIGITSLYLSAVFNAIVYDTVYAHQDLKDDLKAGVKSMAIACLGWTKQWLSFLCFIEVILLVSTGYAMGFGVAYWSITVAGTATVLAYMLLTWKIEDRDDCWYWFCHLIWFTGGTICVGLAGEYLQKLVTM